MSGARWKNSTCTRIRKFFDANPDEELRREDIATKFGVSIKTVEGAIKPLMSEGYLTKTTRCRVAHYRRVA